MELSVQGRASTMSVPSSVSSTVEFDNLLDDFKVQCMAGLKNKKLSLEFLQMKLKDLANADDKENVSAATVPLTNSRRNRSVLRGRNTNRSGSTSTTAKTEKPITPTAKKAVPSLRRGRSQDQPRLREVERLERSVGMVPKEDIEEETSDLETEVLTFELNASAEGGVDPRVREEPVPEFLPITKEKMAKRKVLNMDRWYCISRPQYSKSCGMSSVVSNWNYLFSTLGAGNLPVLSQEKALKIVGIKPPYETVKFGSFTGNKTLITWFKKINEYFGVKGNAKIMYKPSGKHAKTRGVSSKEALRMLMSGLRGTKKSYVYHCFNHYFSPIGFEVTPIQPSDAYKDPEDVPLKEAEVW
eukprot:CAMPEP_0114976666 /NCGR_PEP_ID=MMETSP0216-20121206/2801_1 /TAXON_ID=223996 /ORGANISM="Protocruzia adherens, Strain Boccale" /LENGTH=355 /DNA_ID=CAMNT_0002337623 /DNA_START=72 /DNA_END=1136 /DNA_ORIENTATION=+